MGPSSKLEIWIFDLNPFLGALLILGERFGASYLVPLDQKAQRRLEVC